MLIKLLFFYLFAKSSTVKLLLILTVNQLNLKQKRDSDKIIILIKDLINLIK